MSESWMKVRISTVAQKMLHQQKEVVTETVSHPLIRVAVRATEVVVAQVALEAPAQLVAEEKAVAVVITPQVRKEAQQPPREATLTLILITEDASMVWARSPRQCRTPWA